MTGLLRGALNINENEERYEHIDILIKAPEGDDSWFDRISELIESYCSEGECTCGLESMGGGAGTLDQCYDRMRLSEEWADSVKAADLKFFLGLISSHFMLNEEEDEVFQRLYKAAYWHDEFNEWLESINEDEEDDELE